ncbi:hypothetical protein M408DRAFT_21642 [Serendipita vermifera MAFF 305830]|uniref:Uncharacterized protein n=1 Tax=Serendipita vermifera MAFF 305830 TaxID=933852 RepID=A0A0C3B1V2_SERVB|nr:hypothetical protein M408DRAFT_21642 [Serendipita vermifera MAFF 305830]
MSAFDANVTSAPNGGYRINIPTDTAVVMFGTVTANWKQSVRAAFQHDGTQPGESMNDVYYTFEGSGQGLMSIGPIALPSVVPARTPVLAEETEDQMRVPEPITGPDSTNDGTSVTIRPSNRPRHLTLKFEADRPGAQAGTVASKVTWKKNKVTNYAIYFTFYTEDGGDGDNHDSTFTVNMVLAKKPRVAGK